MYYYEDEGDYNAKSNRKHIYTSCHSNDWGDRKEWFDAHNVYAVGITVFGSNSLRLTKVSLFKNTQSDGNGDWNPKFEDDGPFTISSSLAWEWTHSGQARSFTPSSSWKVSCHKCIVCEYCTSLT
jgi:hypothetical protein